MRTKFLALPFVMLVVTTGCIYEEVPNTGDGGAEPHDGSSEYGGNNGYEEEEEVVVYNEAPYVIDAYGGVYWDGYDDIWAFEAEVDDPDGVYDIVEVWADVYDEYNGDYVESFELFSDSAPYFWASEWEGSSTSLDPFYDQYTVDLVVYDALGDYGYETVWVEVYEDEEEYVPVNSTPEVYDGYAGVYWDSWADDDVWVFEAEVDDPDGVYDVVEVWADVYDEYSGTLADYFPLENTSDPYFWSTEWFNSDTYLDPFYDGYTVDLVAYDEFGDYDVLTIWADTY